MTDQSIPDANPTPADAAHADRVAARVATAPTPASPAPQAPPTLEGMALDQWWCPTCRTANRSLQLRCRSCGDPETDSAIRSPLYTVPAQYK